MRFFNTAGPVRCDEHYCLPPLQRFELDEVMTLIQQKKYFVLHAPRQVGKTSYLLALTDYLNQSEAYKALYVNVETGQTARGDVRRGMQAILGEIAVRARILLNDTLPEQIWRSVLDDSNADRALNQLLTLWTEASDRPLVILIDEIDALVDDTLISVLRQLRAGYDRRPASFPQSVVLCGVRDVRDYRIHSSRDQAIVTGGSAFNIRAASLRMDDFERHEVETLYTQHTQESGQEFTPEALDLAWSFTSGQPWLANALAYEACFTLKQGLDRSQPITEELIRTARENLILRRETHLDQLVDKLQEERVRRVIGPMLQGTVLGRHVREDDIQYVIDLGLVRRGLQGPQIANEIYQEIIPRELSFVTQLNFESLVRPAWYIAVGGRLDVDELLSAFQQFFREHAEHWVERFDYKEAGPQLLLQAFLQRVVNDGGRIEREYGLGHGRTDLLIVWPVYGPEGSTGQVQRVVIELKLRRGAIEDTVQAGLAQTWNYMDRCGADAGHLVIFDRDPVRSWSEKIFVRSEYYKDVLIKVWGCSIAGFFY